MNLTSADLEYVEAELARQSLYEFVKFMWDAVEPGNEFTDGWHIEAICEHLEAVFYGDIKRLIINIPPGHAKSILTNVFWPAWIWINDPSIRFLSASHALKLSRRDNIRFRQLILSDKYQKHWGKKFAPSKDQFNVLEVGNDQTGWKIATSIGGTVTGLRGDILLLDDPNQADDVNSDAIRTTANDWVKEVWSTRLNDPRSSAMVLIQQRLHSEDVTGMLLENDLGYVHLCLPAEYDPSRHCVTPIWEDPRTEPGELLWPERFNDEVISSQRKSLGKFGYAGQYDQLPVPKGGGIIQREWWKLWDNSYAAMLGLNNPNSDVLVFPPFEFVVAAVDGAYTEKTTNDPSAMVVMGVWRDEKDMGKAMLIYAWEKHLTLHGPPILSTDTLAERRAKMGLVEWVDKTCRDFGVNKLLIEGKASGLSLSQEISRLFYNANYSVDIVNPGRLDKVARAHAVVPTFTQEMVYAPDRAYAEKVIDQMSFFPNGKHDDLCDCVFYALTWLRESGILLRPSEQKIIDDDAMRPKGIEEPVYPV